MISFDEPSSLLTAMNILLINIATFPLYPLSTSSRTWNIKQPIQHLFKNICDSILLCIYLSLCMLNLSTSFTKLLAFIMCHQAELDFFRLSSSFCFSVFQFSSSHFLPFSLRILTQHGRSDPCQNRFVRMLPGLEGLTRRKRLLWA